MATRLKKLFSPRSTTCQHLTINSQNAKRFQPHPNGQKFRTNVASKSRIEHSLPRYDRQTKHHEQNLARNFRQPQQVPKERLVLERCRSKIKNPRTQLLRVQRLIRTSSAIRLPYLVSFWSLASWSLLPVSVARRAVLLSSTSRRSGLSSQESGYRTPNYEHDPLRTSVPWTK